MVECDALVLGVSSDPGSALLHDPLQGIQHYDGFTLVRLVYPVRLYCTGHCLGAARDSQPFMDPLLQYD